MDLASFVQTRRRAQTSIAARAIRMLYSIFPHSSHFGRHNRCKRARRRLLEQFDRRVDYINEMNVRWHGGFIGNKSLACIETDASSFPDKLDCLNIFYLSQCIGFIDENTTVIFHDIHLIPNNVYFFNLSHGNIDPTYWFVSYSMQQAILVDKSIP